MLSRIKQIVKQSLADSCLFSAEYRAELYWRLESKRMKALSKENTPLNEVTPTDENNNVNKDVKDNNNNEVK